MSTPYNPNDPHNQQAANQSWGQQPDSQQPDSQQSANQPWGQQSANQPDGQPWGQQPADPYAGQQQWGVQGQQPPADQWGGQPADPYAGQYGGQQQWGGQPQQQGILANDGKSFISSLFDFSFQSFVTPKIIKVVYVIVTAFIGLSIVFGLVSALATGEALIIIFALILLPIVGIIYLALARMSLELYYAVIRLSEDVHERLPRQ